MRLKNVKNEIDHLLHNTIEIDEELHSINYRYIADYYRINAEKDIDENNKVVLNSLSEYPDVSIKITMNDISETYDRVITRDTLMYLSNWAYRYGSTGINVEDMEVPDVGDDKNPINETVYDINDRIINNELTLNDAALALKITELICRKYGFEEMDENIFESKEYNQIMLILDEFNDFIEMKSDGRLNWDMLAKTIKSIEQNEQEQLMKSSGKNKIIRELKNYNGDSIDDFLESKDI